MEIDEGKGMEEENVKITFLMNTTTIFSMNFSLRCGTEKQQKHCVCPKLSDLSAWLYIVIIMLTQLSYISKLDQSLTILDDNVTMT